MRSICWHASKEHHDGSKGAITSVDSEEQVTATLAGGTGNDWDVGDAYEIYLTGTENSVISRIYTDRSRGWKVTKPEELTEDEWFPEDVDVDKDDDHAWGPGQPSRSHK